MEILTTKGRNEIMNKFLKERLELIVPKVMKERNVDAWLVASKEYHEDLVFKAITPAEYLTARRITMMLFVKKDGEVKRLSLSMPDEGLAKFYEPCWNFGKEEQMDALNRVLKEYDPKSIAINISEDFTFADGLSYGLYQTLVKEVDPKYVERFVCDPMIPIKVMEIRTPSELAFMPEIQAIADSIMDEMYSSKQIVPGKTTLEDMVFFMMDKVISLGMEYWFTPTLDSQREGEPGRRETGTIEKGDLLHCDFGIYYCNVCTDTQRLAYVLKDGETDAPAWIKEGFKKNNRFQDIVRETMVAGKTGNEVLKEAREKAIAEGLRPCLYTHPTNMYGHGPGPTIGLWNNQNSIPVKGDVELSYDTCYALELNVEDTYNGVDYFFYSEETITFTEEGANFIYPYRDKITLI